MVWVAWLRVLYWSLSSGHFWALNPLRYRPSFSMCRCWEPGCLLRFVTPTSGRLAMRSVLL